MSGAVINLIIQLIAGALGGIAIASELKNADLGTIGNSIVGAIGGMFLTSLPLLAGTAHTVNIESIIVIIGQAAGGGGVSGAIVGQAVSGGVSGAILTAIVGLIKNAMAGQTAR